MKKSTLTVVVAFVFAIVAACIAFPKLADSKSKPVVKFSKMEVKTKHHEKVTKPKNIIPVEFSLNVSFSPEPKNEQ